MDGEERRPATPQRGTLPRPWRRAAPGAGPAHGASRGSPGLVPGLLLATALVAGGCEAGDSGESPRLRGDRAFARGDREDALAEYRLLMRNDRTADAILRVAHVQTALGRVEDARDLYDEAVALDSVHALQAVSDLVARARDAFANGDGYGGASAFEAALHFQPGILAEDLLLPLARHYGRAGEHGRAQPLYLRAIGRHHRNSTIVLEAALAHEQVGDCERALELFADFAEAEPRRAGETRWPVGTCALRLARELIDGGAVDEVLARLERERADSAAAAGAAAASPEEAQGAGSERETAASDAELLAAAAALADSMAAGAQVAGVVADSTATGIVAAAVAPSDSASADSAGAPLPPPPDPDQPLRDALRYLALVIDGEEPRAMLPEAHFLRAGLLARMGECEAAVAAYSMVTATSATGSEAIVRQARERVDALRFAEGERRC